MVRHRHEPDRHTDLCTQAGTLCLDNRLASLESSVEEILTRLARPGRQDAAEATGSLRLADIGRWLAMASTGDLERLASCIQHHMRLRGMN